MKKIVCINYITEQFFYKKYDFYYDPNKDTLSMFIYLLPDDKESFRDMIRDNEKVEYAITEYNNESEGYIDEIKDKRKIKRYEKAKISDYDEFISGVEYVKFDDSVSDNYDRIEEFISTNKKDLEGYSFIICENDNTMEFLDNHDVLVAPRDSSYILTKKEYSDFRNNFNETVDNIKSLKLSNLENILLVSDLIREKEYKGSNAIDSSKSRDIYSVLYTDTVVCAGYSELYRSILSMLDIKASNITTKDHAFSEIYVNDSKYDVDSLLFSDLTKNAKDLVLDSKDINYLYKYTCCLKPFDFFKKINGKTRVYETFYKRNIKFGASSILKLLNKKDLDFPEYLNCISILRHFLDIICGIDSYFEFDDVKSLALENKDRIDKVTGSEIGLETFLKALSEVRYIENYCDPEKYTFNLNWIFNNSKGYGFKMPSIELTPEARLLRQIFGEKCKLSEDQDPEYIEEVNKKHLVKLYRELKEKYENDSPKVKKANLTLYRYK